jgi:hypothetical protein
MILNLIRINCIRNTQNILKSLLLNDSNDIMKEISTEDSQPLMLIDFCQEKCGKS